jgi:hypothetical protein
MRPSVLLTGDGHEPLSAQNNVGGPVTPSPAAVIALATGVEDPFCGTFKKALTTSREISLQLEDLLEQKILNRKLCTTSMLCRVPMQLS